MLWVRHQAQDVARLAHDAGDGIVGPVRIRPGITERDAGRPLQIDHVRTARVLDRNLEFPSRGQPGIKAARILDPDPYVPTHEAPVAVRNQGAGKQSALAQDLESVADAEHGKARGRTRFDLAHDGREASHRARTRIRPESRPRSVPRAASGLCARPSRPRPRAQRARSPYPGRRSSRETPRSRPADARPPRRPASGLRSAPRCSPAALCLSPQPRKLRRRKRTAASQLEHGARGLRATLTTRSESKSRVAQVSIAHRGRHGTDEFRNRRSRFARARARGRLVLDLDLVDLDHRIRE